MARGVCYVSTTGSDLNGGRVTAPYLTIAKALMNTSVTRVNVASGTYSITDPISPGSVSLFGGYSSDFSVRNANANVTTIAYSGSNSPITYQSSNDGSPTLDGFTITSSTTGYQNGAVQITASSPIISNNKITAPTGMSIFCSSECSPTISDNTITGNGITESYGVYIGQSSGMSVTLSGNIINGGSGSSTYGVYVTALSSPTDSVTLANNTISNSGASTPTTAYGLYVENSGSSGSPAQLTMTGTTIDSGSASSFSYGMYLSSTDYWNINVTGSTIRSGDTSGSTSDSVALNVASGTNYLTLSLSSSSLLSGNGGANNGGETIGMIWANSGGAASILTLTENIISAGAVGYDTYGLALATGGTVTISRNTIFGGGNASTNLSKGIAQSQAGTNTIIANNIIYGGNGMEGQGINPGAAGSIPKIYNNTIIAGTRSGQTYASGILASGGATPFIENNLIYAPFGANKYCIVELNSSSDPSTIKNNNLFGCNTALLYDEGSTNKTTVNDVELLSGNYSGNVNFDPLVNDWDGADNDLVTYADNNVTLTDTTLVNVRQGGLDHSATFTTDRIGTTRTADTSDSPSNANAAGWSIGAYEKD